MVATGRGQSLFEQAVAARRAEYRDLGDASREQRRADERGPWIDDLYTAVEGVVSAVMEHAGGDPAAALVRVVAVSSAWHDAMLDPTRQPAAIGGR